MTKELRIFAETHILKRRESPQLDDIAVASVMRKSKELADAPEGTTAKLLSTGMFPLSRDGIQEGNDSPWNTAALPNNLAFPTWSLSTPKPDAYFGYPTDERSGWSDAQNAVISHSRVNPYVKPARGNTFPFLMVEMKSEAAGGNIFFAENQAAGSGSSSVNALLWLLKEAGTYDSTSQTDTLAFTIAMTHREAIFYLHWYSDADRHHYMSFLDTYSAVKPTEIRECNNIIKNIIDHGLGARKTAIGKALAALFPFPEHWKQARPASAISSTPATSYADEGRPAPAERSGSSK